MDKKQVFIIAGARPNFMKVAPLFHEFKKHSNFKIYLIHTGQHFDREMSDLFITELGLPDPDIYLGENLGSHATQTGEIMIKFEEVCLEEKPNLVVVVGDVNSTIACALVAAKLHIPIAHVEAGLRSFDKTMPEEINRILTDHLSDFLFTTCEDANRNLSREGISPNIIFFVGNVMIDTLTRFIKISKKSDITKRLSLRVNGNTHRYAVVTLHRPSNVDDTETLKRMLSILNQLSRHIPVIFPAHPRTLKRIKEFKLEKMIAYRENCIVVNSDINSKVLLIPPLSYIDFLCLMSNATIVLTDSGGIQEETTILGIPCLTLRNNTERPITVKEGTNIVVGNYPDRVLKVAFMHLNDKTSRIKKPKYWDGRAAERLTKILVNKI